MVACVAPVPRRWPAARTMKSLATAAVRDLVGPMKTASEGSDGAAGRSARRRHRRIGDQVQQPGRRGGNHVAGRKIAVEPGIGVAVLMDAGGGDDVAAEATDIEAGSQFFCRVVHNPGGWQPKDVVHAVAGLLGEGFRQCGMPGFQFGKRAVAAVAVVTVQREDSTGFAGADAEVVGLAVEPLADGACVGGGVGEAVGHQTAKGMFARLARFGLAAGASAVGR